MVLHHASWPGTGDGWMNTSEIADKLGLTGYRRSNLTERLNTMYVRGMIHRRRHPNNPRLWQYLPSAEAEQYYKNQVKLLSSPYVLPLDSG